MGRVIGKNRKQLDDIEQKTGATLKVFQRNALYVKGTIDSQKRAIREIKEIVVSLAIKREARRRILLIPLELD